MRKHTTTNSRGSQATTQHYPSAGASDRRAQNTAVSNFSGAPNTIRPQPLTKLGVGDRGQALVGVGRTGPVRPHEGRSAPMGDSRSFKQAFKTPGTTAKDRENIIVDFAHCKNMKGRFEQLSTPEAPQSAHYSYGCVAGTQFGAVRPQSARGMPSFSSLCNKEIPGPPSTTQREQLDLGLEGREFKLDNVLARAGI